MSAVSHRIAARGARVWHVIDAKDQVLGRLAPQIARLLQGKHKPTFTPSVDCGDFVVVINAKDVALTGDKRNSKLYHWHTGWMGGIKTLTARQMFERDPRRVVSIAVKGMLPDNLLRRTRLTRLRVFPGAEHKHARQVEESGAYAAEHLRTVAPYDVRPRERGETGALVRDAEAELSPAELAELEKGWVQVKHDAAFAAKYDAWRATRTARAQAAQDALDRQLLERMAAMDAQMEAELREADKAKAGKAPEMR